MQPSQRLPWRQMSPTLLSRTQMSELEIADVLFLKWQHRTTGSEEREVKITWTWKKQ